MSDLPSPAPDAPAPRFASPGERRKRKRHQPQRRTRRGRGDLWLESLLFAVVLGSVLAVGTVHVQTLLVVGTFSVATGVLALLLYRRDMGAWPITLPSVGVLALTVWTAVQAIPLPARLVAAIAPKNAEVWAHVLEPLGQAGPAWHPISLDPGATWVEVLKGLTYLGMLLASTVIAYRRGAVYGVGTVFVSAIAAGVLTVAHGLAGMTKVFGIYEPIYFSGAWHMGPLLNSNHLAGYMNLGAMCGIGLLLMRETRIPRGVIGLGVATLFALTMTSGSRGAVLLLPLGVAVVVLLLRQRSSSSERRSVSRRWLNVLSLGALAGGVGLAALGITTSQWNQLVDKDLSKLSIVSWAKPLVFDHPLFGIGRGAFETVYPAYRPNVGHLLWTHPENLLVQWTAEWGIPVGLAAAVFFVWLIRPSRIGATRSAVAAGALGGIVVLVLQNWVDFSLELPSVAIAVVVLVGSCWADTARRGVGKWDARAKIEHEHEHEHGPERVLRRYGVAVVFGVVGMASVVVAWRKALPTPLADRTAFHALIDGPPMSKAQFDPLIRAAMLRHPSEPFLPLVGAERAWRVHDDNPVPYLQQVLTRAKVYGRAHLLLSEILFWRNADAQALMELRLACRDEPGLTTHAVALALERVKDHDELERMVPAGPDGAAVLDTLGAWLHKPEPELGRRFDQEALQRNPSLVAPRMRRATDLVAALNKTDVPGCKTDEERRACADAIEQDAKRIEEASPQSFQAARLRADAFLALGRPEDAAKVLDLACDHVKERLGCLQAQVKVVASLKREDEVGKLLDQIAAAGCTSPAACSQTWSWIGGFAAGRKNTGTAVNAYRKATSNDPQNAGAWIGLGNASSTLGLHAQAAEAYDRALKLGKGDDALRKKRDAEKAKALEALPGRSPLPGRP